MAGERTTWRQALAMILVAGFLGLGLVELAARVWVGARWPQPKIDVYTKQSATRGRYVYDAKLAYALTPNFVLKSHNTYTHDHRGFRSPEVDDVKPAGALRIAFIGGSTTYNPNVSDEDTYPAVVGRLLAEPGRRVEVINAGTPGWSSRENLEGLRSRVLPLRPDIVVIYEGRNDLQPQGFNHFRADYSHFRRPRDFAHTNETLKQVHRLSYAVMMLTHRYGPMMGWNDVAESPLYGSIRFENHPTPAQAIENFTNPAIDDALRANLEAMVQSSRAAGAKVVIATMAFLPDRYRSGALHGDASMIPALGAQLDANNATARAVAEREHAVLAETAVLAEEPELLIDDCHMGAEGLARRARIVADAIVGAGLVAAHEPTAGVH